MNVEAQSSKTKQSEIGGEYEEDESNSMGQYPIEINDEDTIDHWKVMSNITEEELTQGKDLQLKNSLA